MEDIKKLWNEANIEYKDMYSRLAFVEKKNKNLFEKKFIRDKIILLTNDVREIINTMEKISSSIDDNYAEQGTIKFNKKTHEQERMTEGHVSETNARSA